MVILGFRVLLILMLLRICEIELGFCVVRGQGMMDKSQPKSRNDDMRVFLYFYFNGVGAFMLHGDWLVWVFGLEIPIWR